MLLPELHDQLEAESLAVLETAEWLRARLAADGAGFDHSPLVLMCFKLIEIEVRTKIFEKYRSSATPAAQEQTRPFIDEYGREVTAFVDYLQGKTPLAVGEMMHIS